MKTKKIMVCLTTILIAIGLLLGDEVLSKTQKSDRIQMGMYEGRVSYDAKDGFFYIEVRGARFPFRTDPREALTVPLDAPGDNSLAKHSTLLQGMMGKEVSHTTILINPEEENKVWSAVADLALYMQIVNKTKYNGFAYTQSGGRSKQSVRKGNQIRSLDSDATSSTPIVQLKGPKSGGTQTAVRVLGGGKFVVEGKTYEELYRAADFLSVTLLKMLCGSADCPDAAACASGQACGCG